MTPVDRARYLRYPWGIGKRERVVIRALAQSLLRGGDAALQCRGDYASSRQS